MAGGSRKGFPYERDMSRKLSLWLTKGERDNVLWRTEGSGGRSTTNKKKGRLLTNSYGDIGVKDPNCAEARNFINKVLIECKKGYSKDLDGLDLIDKKRGIPLLLQWWIKCQKEASECGRKHIWLIARRNGKEDIIVTDDILTYLANDYLQVNIKDKYPKISTLYIMRLNDFLPNVNYDYYTREDNERKTTIVQVRRKK